MARRSEGKPLVSRWTTHVRRRCGGVATPLLSRADPAALESSPPPLRRGTGESATVFLGPIHRVELLVFEIPDSGHERIAEQIAQPEQVLRIPMGIGIVFPRP